MIKRWKILRSTPEGLDFKTIAQVSTMVEKSHSDVNIVTISIWTRYLVQVQLTNSLAPRN